MPAGRGSPAPTAPATPTALATPTAPTAQIRLTCSKSRELGAARGGCRERPRSLCWKDPWLHTPVPHGQLIQSSAPLCSRHHRLSRQHQDQRAGPCIPAPNPRLWTWLQRPESHFLPLHIRADTTGLWKGELTLGKRQKHDEGRSSLQRKFYIAYDLLSGNIKQFKQPTLNHSDSSTLPTTPRLPSPSSPRPASPPRSPGSKRSLLPCPRASSTRVGTHTGRDTAGTERGPRLEAGGDELRFHH